MAGKDVEGESAFVTVTATIIALKLGVPLILYKNIPRMMQSKAWGIAAAALLAAAGYIWSSVIMSAIDCRVPQNRRRVFVAATRQGPRAAQRLHAWRSRLAALKDKPSAVRVCVQDVLRRLIPFFFFNSRSSDAL
jgi:site-specific DNA-cytosine methylase